MDIEFLLLIKVVYVYIYNEKERGTIGLYKALRLEQKLKLGVMMMIVKIAAGLKFPTDSEGDAARMSRETMNLNERRMSYDVLINSPLFSLQCDRHTLQVGKYPSQIIYAISALSHLNSFNPDIPTARFETQ